MKFILRDVYQGVKAHFSRVFKLREALMNDHALLELLASKIIAITVDKYFKVAHVGKETHLHEHCRVKTSPYAKVNAILKLE